MLPGTPFHERTSALCQGQNWRRWAGHLVASSYELNHEREYWAIRSAAGLIDVSPLHKYHIRGPDAQRYLSRLVTRDLRKCDVGRVMYTTWCDADGKIIDDGTLARLGEDSYRLTSAQPSLLWLHDNLAGMDVIIEDESDAIAALALQGPNSRDILKALADSGTDLDTLGFFRLTDARLDGIPVTISRTGYTGDLGYEIWVEADAAIELWDTLMNAGAPYGILPAGMLALDMARIEAGLMLITVDYVPTHEALLESQKSSPLEMGLGWTVNLEKDYFVGRDALVAEAEHGPAWLFRGLHVDWDGLEQAYGEVGLPPLVPASAWRTSVPVYRRGRQVGYATSGCWSPLLKQYLALAHLEASSAEPETRLEIEVTVEHRRKRVVSTVAELPFIDLPRKRA